MYTILKPGTKGIVIINVSDLSSSNVGVLEEGYNKPWNREGDAVATLGVVDDIAINHTLFKYVLDRTLRNFSSQFNCNRSMGINFYCGRNSCHHDCGTPRKCSSSVLLSELLPCVLKDINKLSCKALEFQQSSDQCIEKFQAMVFDKILQKKFARICNVNFVDSTNCVL